MCKSSSLPPVQSLWPLDPSPQMHRVATMTVPQNLDVPGQKADRSVCKHVAGLVLGNRAAAEAPARSGPDRPRTSSFSQTPSEAPACPLATTDGSRCFAQSGGSCHTRFPPTTAQPAGSCVPRRPRSPQIRPLAPPRGREGRAVAPRAPVAGPSLAPPSPALQGLEPAMALPGSPAATPHSNSLAHIPPA